MTKEAVIVSGVRTPVGRAGKGALAGTRPDDLAALVIAEAVKRAEGLAPDQIEDVVLGCSFPEAEQGLNMARIALLRAGLPASVPGQTVNRFCSSGLQAIAIGAGQIMAGLAEVVLSGGVESMSMVPMRGNKFAPNPRLADEWPGVYINMGLTAENVAARYGVSRADQDAFALRSNQRAIAAIDSGAFDGSVIPVQVSRNGGTAPFSRDEGPRRDTSAEALAALKPAFKTPGTVTAGNSSQMSDGAAAVVLMERSRAESMGLTPRARFVSFAVGGVEPEVMGIGPVVAIPKALKLAGLTLDEIGLIELNEAFAAQALAVCRELGIDLDKVNVNGGAIALGHPLGCTGAKLTVQIMDEMKRRGVRYGLVTMCIGGGMGAAGVFENLQ